MRYLLVGCGNEYGKRVVGECSPSKDFSDGVLVKWDKDPDIGADVVHDLDVLPYPFEDNEFDEIHAYEVLEHCGKQGDGDYFFAQFAEFWRMLKPGGIMAISVPQWDCSIQWGVPDHKRCLPPDVFGFLDITYYDNLGKPGYADYRKLLGTTRFTIIGLDKSRDLDYIVMRANKNGD